MAKADIERVVEIEKEWFWKAITDYASYPRFVKGCSSISVKREDPTTALLSYKVNLIKEVEYVLKHKEDESKGVMSWELVSSPFMKTNRGKWELKDLGDGKTNVRYDLEIDFTFPAPSFVVSKLIRSNLPELLEDMEERAQEIKSQGGKS